MARSFAQRVDRGRRYWDQLSPLAPMLGRAAGSLGSCGLHHLGLGEGQEVLDIGCGAGAAFPFLCAAVGPTGRVVGIDLSPRMLELARARAEEHAWTTVELREAEFSTASVEPERFDAAVAVFALSAMADLPAAVRVARHALRSGGRLLVVDLDLTPRGWAVAPLIWIVRGLYRRRAGASADDLAATTRTIFGDARVVEPAITSNTRRRISGWPPLTLLVATR